MREILRLKKSNCKNCYKCIRHCPVKSIRFSANQAHILPEECILCGECFVVCPQNAKEVRDDVEKLNVMILEGSTVIASVAPSFVANYRVGFSAMRTALKKLGFADAEETAIGATMVKKAYEKLIKTTDGVLISSCCPAVNKLITTHYPKASAYLANVVTPMSAHCEDIKKRYPDAKTVFIGPCIAKKAEGDEEGVDAVLTFEELTCMLNNKGITFDECEKEEGVRASSFPISGGIIACMDKERDDFEYIKVDGLQNCVQAINDVVDGEVNKCFIEMSACSGSCVGGPVMEQKNSITDYIEVKKYVGQNDACVDMNETALKKRYEPDCERRLYSKEEIDAILKLMGKTLLEHELNCGSCGYDSCRDKAIAVMDGKAEPSMCLPFLYEKTETFSGHIVNNSPNAIIVLNDELEVQQINKAALELMSIRSAADVLGDGIVRILDPADFIFVKKNGLNVRDKQKYLAEYKKHVEMTIIYDKSYKLFMCIMRDITKEETAKERKELINRQTVETADNVVEKQMRIVQEIASLLGETAAETKIALTRLKESLKDE